MATVELRFSALPANVRTARLLAATLARRSGLDEAVIDEVKLAVGEACARAVEVHRNHAPDEQVLVSFEDGDGTYAVTVRDRAPRSADVEVVELPEVDVDALAAPSTSSIGPLLPPGFGLAIVAGLVDDVTVAPDEPGTSVRMAWPRTSLAAS